MRNPTLAADGTPAAPVVGLRFANPTYGLLPAERRLRSGARRLPTPVGLVAVEALGQNPLTPRTTELSRP